MNKYIVIGDIHGCGKTLVKLLDRLEAYPDRKIIFIGDYIDRGPNSAIALDTAIKLADERDCVFLRGNHEEMMLDAFERQSPGNWTINGGMQTMISLRLTSLREEIPHPYKDFLESTLMYHDTEEYFFVHAGLPAERKIADMLQDESDVQSMLWERTHLDSEYQVWEKTVVFGHTPVPEPIITEKMIGIDTGCVFHSRKGLGKLTALLLPERETIQVENCEF